MAVSRMLKIQLFAHESIREDVKAFLREAGVIEVTDVSVEGFRGEADETETASCARLLETVDSTIQFLDPYVPRKSFAERMSGGPLQVSAADIEKTLAEADVAAISGRCRELETTMRGCRDELTWSAALARELEPWLAIKTPFETLSTEKYGVQFWTFSEKTIEAALSLLSEKLPLSHVQEVARAGGVVRSAIIVPRGEAETAAELLKQSGGVRSAFENLEGTPAAIIEKERDRRLGLESEIERAREEARTLLHVRPALLTLSDHYREKRGLIDVERHFHRTERTFVIEGWMCAVNKRRLEKDLSKRWSEIELVTRPPRDGEDPPIHLENRPAAQPFEFIMTLYGRPLYNEVDPTPLLAPFFVLCFAICMSDAGYGLTLAALCAFLIFKVRIQGGMQMLLKVLLAGSLLTLLVGVATGGYFGMDASVLPESLRKYILIDPLEEPMKMLNVAFLVGIVHILFGIGIRMAVNFRAHIWADAIFDDLGWILFLITLVPLGFAYVLGGAVPRWMLFYCSRAALGLAAVLFIAGIRKERNRFMGAFKSLIKFYSITGYFSDVLSYARLLALGLASAAIAVAINSIAQMVKGFPFYTGYVAAVVVLLLGHAFNLAVNVLGAFVHSARLQYLEFFGKFFTGGGREFHPFRSERRYTTIRETGSKV
ncbi:MAG: V-type ATPase 116kDa subunit family protein [Candidatus Krumholzibacteria bacterium]|nr:V-type ATPase 116kDa subunit family protein [Candidatus Krumholzibacteria bacterium]